MTTRTRGLGRGLGALIAPTTPRPAPDPAAITPVPPAAGEAPQPVGSDGHPAHTRKNVGSGATSRRFGCYFAVEHTKFPAGLRVTDSQPFLHAPGS